MSDGQAMLKGVVAGAAEAVFEKIPLDNLFSIGNKSGVTKKVLEVLKQMGLEGTEEVGTDVANAIADGIISGDQSDYNIAVRSYMTSGLSESEAKKKAAADFAKQIGMSFAGGAISGGVLGTGAELLNSAGSKKRVHRQAASGQMAHMLIQWRKRKQEVARMDEQERRRIWAELAAYYGNPDKEPPEPDLELRKQIQDFTREYQKMSKEQRWEMLQAAERDEPYR